MSIGGVLITDIVANVVGGYISEQIKTWQVPDQAKAPDQAPATREASAVDAEAVSSIPGSRQRDASDHGGGGAEAASRANASDRDPAGAGA